MLSGKHQSSGTSAAATRGTLLHELFERACTCGTRTDAEYEQAIGSIMGGAMEALYASGASDEDEHATEAFLRQHVNLIRSWVDTYLAPATAGLPPPQAPPPPGAIAIQAVLQAEENVWSPQFGLKGKVDLSLRRLTADDGVVVPAALELKTGRRHQEHEAQVMLYSLLMSDRYGVAVEDGLLLYLSPQLQEMTTVRASRPALMGIMMQRNALAARLRADRGDARCRTLPRMVRNERQCSRCYQQHNCFLFHRAAEGGTAQTCGVDTNLFSAAIGHLSDHQLDYCRAHLQMIEAEAAEDRSAQHELWTADSATREASGLALGQLKIESEELQEDSGKSVYRLVREGGEALPAARLSPGDYVVASAEWPRRQTAVSTGFVQAVEGGCVSVSLAPRLTPLAGQPDGEQDPRRWRLDKDELSGSAQTLRTNLAGLFCDTPSMGRLRSLCIDLEAPRYSERTALADSGSAQLDELNAEQRRAIDFVGRARDYALILGMPGTGKTTTIARLVQALAGEGKSVLLASFTNAAVDNILIKLQAYGNLDLLRIGSVSAVHPSVVEYTVAGGLVEHTPSSLRQAYSSAAVVATTCLGTKHAMFSKRSFDYCIVDEASQISQAMCLGPLRCATVFVLVGDHYQLPPLVRSASAQSQGMGVSLFSRLAEAHPQAVHKLNAQYRMNEPIMSLANELVYGGQLRCGAPSVAAATLDLPEWAAWGGAGWLKQALDPSSPVVFVDTDGASAELEARSGDALQNVAEASIVAQLVAGLLSLRVPDDAIGIISPYRSQQRVIRSALQQQVERPTDRVEVNTIDRYQGRDKDCIIISLVRSNSRRVVGELLKDWRRTNVAITRAKRKMVLVGSAQTLRASAVFDQLLSNPKIRRLSWPGDAGGGGG